MPAFRSLLQMDIVIEHSTSVICRLSLLYNNMHVDWFKEMTSSSHITNEECAVFYNPQPMERRVKFNRNLKKQSPNNMLYLKQKLSHSNWSLINLSFTELQWWPSFSLSQPQKFLLTSECELQACNRQSAIVNSYCILSVTVIDNMKRQMNM